MKWMTKILICGFLFATPVVAQTTDSEAEKRDRRETDVVRATRAAKDAVVNINTTILMRTHGRDEIFPFLPPGFFPDPRPAHSLGSGFILHEKGYIITNAHVVRRAQEINVSFADKTTAEALAVYLDDKHDLALIKIDPPKPLHVLPLGRGDDLMIGETVIAIGNPLGYQHTVTSGVVSAVDRSLEIRGQETYNNLIQTDASINPGNSGGPLLNINGELIGINTAIRGDAQNIGFAINVDVLKQILPELLNPEKPRRIDLGVKFVTTPDNRVQIISVDVPSPAHAADVQAGDLVVACDGNPIDNPIDFYIELLERPAGENLNLTLLRRDRTLRVAIPFEIKPKPDGLELARRRLGLILRELTPEQARKGGLANRPFLIVEEVLPDTHAQQAGIRRGDIIDQLDRYRINSLDEVGQILENPQSNQPMRVGVARISGNMYTSTTVTLRLQ